MSVTPGVAPVRAGSPTASVTSTRRQSGKSSHWGATAILVLGGLYCLLPVLWVLICLLYTSDAADE